jgi:hypothetical protein
MARTVWLGAAVLAAAATSAWAEDTYTLKLKESVTGDVAVVEDSYTTTTTMKVLDAAGKALDDKAKKETVTYVFTETTLAREAGKPASKLRRHYDKAEVKDGDKTTPLPFQGKTVVIERKDGKYSFQTDDGKDLSEDDATRLRDEFKGKDEDMPDPIKVFLPAKAVAVNDPWKIDMDVVLKQMAKTVPASFDAGKSKGTAVLTKVYKKDDRQFGVIHLDIELPVKSFGEGANKLAADDGAKFTIGMDMDVCIDGQAVVGTAKNDMKMDVSAAVPLPGGGKGKVVLSSQVSITQTQKEQPKK